MGLRRVVWTGVATGVALAGLIITVEQREADRRAASLERAATGPEMVLAEAPILAAPTAPEAPSAPRIAEAAPPAAPAPAGEGAGVDDFALVMREAIETAPAEAEATFALDDSQGWVPASGIAREEIILPRPRE
jgi:hypothetical protein